MNVTKSAAAVALAGALGFVWAGQAAASVHARSYVDIDDLSIIISDDGGASAGGATIDNFNFTATNTASLEGAPVIDDASCSGLPAPGANSCNTTATNPAGTGANNGINDANSLNAEVVNAPGSVPLRAEGDFSFFGPGANQYANADSVIETAQITGDTFTSTEQIAEAELQGGTAASSSAEIQSNTGFTFEFTVAGANVLLVSFDALLDITASIFDPLGSLQTAQANVTVELTLENDDTGDLAIWRPDGGTLTGTCISSFGTCTELLDDFDLNGDAGTSTDGTVAAGSRSTFGSYSLLLDGLTDGNWTLTLNVVTSTSLSRTAEEVPEPGPLVLLGAGVIAMGAATRRRRNKKILA